MKRINPSSSSKNSGFDTAQYLYLTTRGRKSGKTREIEIWFTHREGRFYVIAEYASSNWVRNVQADPQVQVRVEARVFNATARVLDEIADRELIAAVQALSRAKYEWSEGLVVELVPG